MNTKPKNKLITNSQESNNNNKVQRLSDDPTPKPKLTANAKNKTVFKDIINDNTFLNITNGLYKNLPDNLKYELSKNLSYTTSIDVGNLNKQNNKKPKLNNTISNKAYEQLVNGLRIYSNPGGGNCFYKAVCDGITNHNHEYPNNPILYNNIGIGQNIFTVKILREIVYDYLINLDPDILNEYLTVWAPHNADNLNTIFNNQLQSLIEVSEEINDETYLNTMNEIYTSKDNFLVTKISQMPSINSETYSKPFTVVTESQLKPYILSSQYWGNNISIYAILDTLKLNIIPIEMITVNERNVLRVNSTTLVKDNNIKNTWTKYMFLYVTPGHFELMGFIFKTKLFARGKETKNHTVTVFDRYTNNSQNFMAPIYINFIIYASYYRNLLLELRNNFNYYPEIFKYIYESEQINNKNNDNLKQQINKVFSQLQNAHTIIQSGGLQITDNDEDTKTEICYKIQISLQLVEGTDIDQSQINSLGCQSKVNSIYKSLADIRGKNYIPPPNYSLKKKKKTVDNKKKGGNRKTRKKNVF